MSAPEDKKNDKKPFKGVSALTDRKAQVLWPADMPDDMLEDAIKISKEAMEEFPFETHGEKVSE